MGKLVIGSEGRQPFLHMCRKPMCDGMATSRRRTDHQYIILQSPMDFNKTDLKPVGALLKGGCPDGAGTFLKLKLKRRSWVYDRVLP